VPITSNNAWPPIQCSTTETAQPEPLSEPAPKCHVDRPAGVRTPLSANPGLRVLAWTYRFWKRRPVRPLPFRSLLSQLAPMEGSHLHHVSGKEGACQPSQSLALSRFAEAFFTGFHHALPTENGQRYDVRTLSAQGTISLAIRKTIPAPHHCPQRFLSSTWAKCLADLFIVAALRGSSRRSLGPRAVSNSETLAVHRICPALTHLVAHFLARLFAPGLTKRPTNFAAHAPSRVQ
jgi:hypothetical protein